MSLLSGAWDFVKDLGSKVGNTLIEQTPTLISNYINQQMRIGQPTTGGGQTPIIVREGQPQTQPGFIMMPPTPAPAQPISPTMIFVIVGAILFVIIIMVVMTARR